MFNSVHRYIACWWLLSSVVTTNNIRRPSNWIIMVYWLITATLHSSFCNFNNRKATGLWFKSLPMSYTQTHSHTRTVPSAFIDISNKIVCIGATFGLLTLKTLHTLFKEYSNFSPRLFQVFLITQNDLDLLSIIL